MGRMAARTGGNGPVGQAQAALAARPARRGPPGLVATRDQVAARTQAATGQSVAAVSRTVAAAHSTAAVALNLTAAELNPAAASPSPAWADLSLADAALNLAYDRRTPAAVAGPGRAPPRPAGRCNWPGRCCAERAQHAG